MSATSPCWWFRVPCIPADWTHRGSDIWTCPCDACARIDVLDLKFILHAGPYVIHRGELVGPEVVIAHRLLKTGAAELVGHGAFALITAAAAARFGIPTEAAVPIVETYEHYPPISAHVFPLRDQVSPGSSADLS